MTTIRINGTAVRYRDWSVTAGTSDTTLAPVATVVTASREATAGAGDRLEVERDDGTTLFVGDIVSAPTRNDGSQKLTCEHDYHRVFDESVSFNLTSPTAEDVLEQALTNSDGGSSFDLNYFASTTSLSDDYSVTNRSVKRVFRDMADRVGAVWWVDTGDSVTFDEPGDRGTWAAIDSSTDRFAVKKYDAADLETVVNAQTVTGTGGEAVSFTAEDSTSISNYGRREGDPVNVKYITSGAEAEDYAQALLQPEPEAGAEVVVPDGVGGDTTQILANYLLDVDDPNGTGMDDTLVIEEQIIEEGRMTVKLGAASARGKIAVNRSAKSQEDVTEPGSVYPSDRIGELSITTTKIDDRAVETPKIATEAITANEIDVLDLDTTQLSISDDPSNPTTGIEFAIDSQGRVDLRPLPGTRADIGFEERMGSVFSESVRPREELAVGQPPAASLANGNSLFDPDNGDTAVFIAESDNITSIYPATDNAGQVGKSGNAFADIYAYNFIDAGTGSSINDGGDPLAGLADGHGPPDHAAVTDDAGETVGYSLTDMARDAIEVCRAQQSRIETLEERVAALEDKA